MSQNYRVCGIILDRYDNRRSFEFVVEAKDESEARAKAGKMICLCRGDIVRDIHVDKA